MAQIQNNNSAGDLGDPPAYLTRPLRTIWNELTASAPVGLLTPGDRIAAELLCRLVDRMRRRGIGSRSGGLSVRELGIMMRLLSSFALTPRDRARVAKRVPTPFEKKVGPWAN